MPQYFYKEDIDNVPGLLSANCPGKEDILDGSEHIVSHDYVRKNKFMVEKGDDFIKLIKNNFDTSSALQDFLMTGDKYEDKDGIEQKLNTSMARIEDNTINPFYYEPPHVAGGFKMKVIDSICDVTRASDASGAYINITFWVKKDIDDPRPDTTRIFQDEDLNDVKRKIKERIYFKIPKTNKNLYEVELKDDNHIKCGEFLSDDFIKQTYYNEIKVTMSSNKFKDIFKFAETDIDKYKNKHIFKIKIKYNYDNLDEKRNDLRFKFTENGDYQGFGNNINITANTAIPWSYYKMDADKITVDLSGCYFSESSCLSSQNTNLIYEDISMTWNICNTNKIPQQSLRKKTDFLLVIFISSLALLALGICGTCYEFWLKYGDSIDCLYYKSNCKNAGPKIVKSNGDTANGEISLIDYMYPNNISYYPYQRCDITSNKFPSQSGGNKNETAGFRSNYKQYALNKTRCIKVYQDKDQSNRRPFPYNLADYANENINSEILKMPFKSFSFSFLFPVLLSRIILNIILKSLSNIYQKTIDKNVFMKTLVFLIANGLIITIISAIAGNSSGGAMGPFSVVFGLIFISNFFMNLTPSTLLMLFPKTLFWIINGGDKSISDDCKRNLVNDSKAPKNKNGIGDHYAYYRIIGPKSFYPITKGLPTEKHANGRPLNTRIFNFIKNLWMVPAILFMFIISMITGIIAFILSILYLSSSIVFNTFYIPLSNPLEFFDLLKSHSQVLTLLYCAFVVGGMSKLGFEKNTIAVSSGVLGIIIIYKLISTKWV